MPTKRRRRMRELVPQVSPAVIGYLLNGEYPGRDADGKAVTGWVEVGLKTAGNGAALRADWMGVREALLAAWLPEHAGRRPWAWWRFSAPRWQRQDLPDRLRDLSDAVLQDIAEPRRRLGGIGDPMFEHLNVWPCFAYGRPAEFVTAEDVEFYNGRATDFTGRAIDPRHPPTYESQASYLLRHGLLTKGERARLTPVDFEAEVIRTDDENEDDDARY